MTTLSPPKKANNKQANKKLAEHILPVEELWLGTQRLPEDSSSTYYIVWKESESLLTLRLGEPPNASPHKETFQMDRVNGLQVRNDIHLPYRSTAPPLVFRPDS